MNSYHEFIASKQLTDQPTGFEAGDLNPKLFDWQAEIIRWGCRRGRFGGYEDCGLGKSFQQLESARLIHQYANKPVMIFAPLAVAEQTRREALKFGVECEVNVCKQSSDVRNCINVANYERLSKFDPSQFGGVILDEGSILKSLDGKTRNALLTNWSSVPYRQSWSATPAPNDFMEIGNQAEFLGVMKRSEMLATFFVHDGGDTSKWRLKGHAKDAFWQWMASWCVMLRRPSDLGYSDDGYDLPPINYRHHYTDSTAGDGQLFAIGGGDLSARRSARKNSLSDRVARAAELAATDQPCVAWCNLNDEGTELAKAIPDAVEVAGRHSIDQKEEILSAFCQGQIRCLITKPKIGGHGLNWQHCPHTIVFPTDSFEQWYQMIRRFWRFGQKRSVTVDLVASEAESGVIQNLQRKEAEAREMFDGIASAMSDLSREAIRSTARTHTQYLPQERMEIPTWMAS